MGGSLVVLGGVMVVPMLVVSTVVSREVVFPSVEVALVSTDSVVRTVEDSAEGAVVSEEIAGMVSVDSAGTPGVGGTSVMTAVVSTLVSALVSGTSTGVD